MSDERHEKALEAAGWVKHDGKEMPVAGETLVDIRCRHEHLWVGGECFPSRAKTLRWEHIGIGGDILAYRLHLPNHFTNGE